MRLWSLHPSQLDAKGLVALWREGLLARHVLAGKTRGYRAHPQLQRFRLRPDPLAAIDRYLAAVADEADARGYSFDRGKIRSKARAGKLVVTRGQLRYEWKHLLRKLARRDRARWKTLSRTRPVPHPLFVVVAGRVPPWEKLTPRARRA